MSEIARVELPSRRPSIYFDFNWRDIPFTGCLGFSKELKPLEIFLSCGKTSSNLESLGKDAAILISIALRRGATFDELRKSIARDEQGNPATLVGTMLDEVQKIDPGETERTLQEYIEYQGS